MKNNMSYYNFALLTLFSFLFFGCGNKSGNNGNISSFGYSGASGSSSYVAMRTAKSTTACSNGTRLSRDLAYNIQGQISHTRICGTPQQGSMNGAPGISFVGISTTNDLMVVTEVKSGGAIIGHNIYISLCSVDINQSSTIPLIGNDRIPTSFNLTSENCIITDKDNYCPYGFVDSARNTYLLAPQYNYQYNGFTGTLSSIPIYTTFYKPTCNKKY